MVNDNNVDQAIPFRKTQFTFTIDPYGRPDPTQPGTKHAKTVVKTHRVFINADESLTTIDSVLDVLRREKVIA